mgnify:CR=1 FL=1
MTRRYVLNFLRKVKIDENGCWIWQGTIDTEGYGRFYWRGFDMFAHRTAYTMYKGEILKGVETDHLCRVRSCVNPAHLEMVTHQINILRGESPAAKHAKKTHCPYGHAYDAANTLRYIKSNGMFRRVCRTCRRKR